MGWKGGGELKELLVMGLRRSGRIRRIHMNEASGEWKSRRSRNIDTQSSEGVSSPHRQFTIVERCGETCWTQVIINR